MVYLEYLTQQIYTISCRNVLRRAQTIPHKWYALHQTLQQSIQDSSTNQVSSSQLI